MPEPERKMAFYEIGKGGQYAQWMQREFERAQQLATETNQPIAVVSTITVNPPSAEHNGKFGGVNFVVSLRKPPRKSIVFTTELKNGFIVNDGEDIADVLQEELNFPDINKQPLNLDIKEKKG